MQNWKKEAYQDDEHILAIDGQDTTTIVKVSQSIVESSNGSTESLNAYHFQCVYSINGYEHNVRLYDIKQVTI